MSPVVVAAVINSALATLSRHPKFLKSATTRSTRLGPLPDLPRPLERPADPSTRTAWPPKPADCRQLPVQQLIARHEESVELGHAEGADVELRKMLPAALWLQGVGKMLQKLAADGGSSGGDSQAFRRWSEKLSHASDEILRLAPPDERNGVLCFRSAYAVLTLDLLEVFPKWILHATLDAGDLPEPTVPLAALPLKRTTTLLNSLSSTGWTLYVPKATTYTLQVVSEGDRRPSWRKRLKLPGFQDEDVPSVLQLKWNGQSPPNGDLIAGTYILLDIHMGGTPHTTYRRQSSPIDRGDATRPPVYLHLFVPSPGGKGYYIVTRRPGPVPFGTPRRDIARLSQDWRPAYGRPTENVKVTYDHEWIADDHLRFGTTTTKIDVVHTIHPKMSRARPITALRIRVPAVVLHRTFTGWVDLRSDGRDVIRPIAHLLTRNFKPFDGLRESPPNEPLPSDIQIDVSSTQAHPRWPS